MHILQDEKQLGTTLGDRVLAHVRAHQRGVTTHNAPEMLTTDGIAAALGKTRGHISLSLAGLVAEGEIVIVLRHVPGHGHCMQIPVVPKHECITPTDHARPKHVLQRLEAKMDGLYEKIDALEKIVQRRGQ